MTTYAHLIGHPVLVRADRAGVFLGTLTAATNDGSLRLRARKLWSWAGALDSTVLAASGPAGRRIGPMSDIVLPPAAGLLEVVAATPEALAALEQVQPWAR